MCVCTVNEFSLPKIYVFDSFKIDYSHLQEKLSFHGRMKTKTFLNSSEYSPAYNREFDGRVMREKLKKDPLSGSIECSEKL